MRVRKKKHGAERLAACSDYIIKNTAELERKPFVLEIGCGKGGFITEAALREPEVAFVAMECQSNVILHAVEKAKAMGLQNVKFIIGNADALSEYIGEREVQRIHLNFSDPWPKKGHCKRRLTYRSFLEQYKRALVPGGEIWLKTDNDILFDSSLEEFAACGFELDELTRDLHSSEYAAYNIITEYEENFSGKGFKIKRVIARLK